jgi:hypothetical protein
MNDKLNLKVPQPLNEEDADKLSIKGKKLSLKKWYIKQEVIDALLEKIKEESKNG